MIVIWVMTTKRPSFCCCCRRAGDDGGSAVAAANDFIDAGNANANLSVILLEVVSFARFD